MGVKSIKFTSEAREEFHKVKCFMEFKGFDEEFWIDVDKQLNFIKDFPEAFQVRYKNIRIITMDRFNYSIHYVEKSYGILVYRFINQNQDF